MSLSDLSNDKSGKSRIWLVGRVSSLEKEEGQTIGVAVGKVVAVASQRHQLRKERSGVSHQGTWRNGVPGRETARVKPQDRRLTGDTEEAHVAGPSTSIK